MESITAQAPNKLNSHVDSSYRLTVDGFAIGLAEAEQDWGWFAIAATPRGVCAATFGHRNYLEAGKTLEANLQVSSFSAESVGESVSTGMEEIAETAVRELLAFFAGRGTSFSVPLAVVGTSFQQATWDETRTIQFGELATYRDIAARIGRPQAYRAVGNALGQNPLPVIVPCHRVIASDGSFGGYTRGLPWKERLLELEDSLASVRVK